MTTPSIPLDQFQLNFTGMFLCWSSFKIVQRLIFCVQLWLLEKYPNFKILLHNPLVWFQDNLIEMFLEWPSTKTVQAILISLINRAARRHQERHKMTKLYNSIFSSPMHEVQGRLSVVCHQHFILLTLYRLHFASNLHESLPEHSSPSNLGQVRNWAIRGQKLGH